MYLLSFLHRLPRKVTGHIDYPVFARASLERIVQRCVMPFSKILQLQSPSSSNTYISLSFAGEYWPK